MELKAMGLLIEWRPCRTAMALPVIVGLAAAVSYARLSTVRRAQDIAGNLWS